MEKKIKKLRPDARHTGKIRLGVKVAAKKGMPSNTQHFVLKDAPAVADKYGNDPHEIHFQFISDDEAVTMPTLNRHWAAGGKAICQGNGGSAAEPGEASYMWKDNPNIRSVSGITNKPGAYYNSYYRDCKGVDCPDYHKKGCQRQTYLKVICPLVSLTDVYQIDTGSINTLQDFWSALEEVKRTGLFYEGLGPVFKMYKKDASKPGKNFKYVSCHLDMEFWPKHGEEIMRQRKAAVGIPVIEKHGNDFAQMTSLAKSVEMKPDPMEINPEAAEEPLKPMSPQSAMRMAPHNVDPEASKALGEDLEKAVTIENDPEVRAAVESVYTAKGKPFPASAVKNAIAKYQTKERIIQECAKAVEMYSATKQSPPPAPPQETKSSSGTTSTLL